MAYRFEPRIERALTIPARYYFDSQLLAEENRRIFGTTWQLVGRSEQVAEPGQYFTVAVAEEPVLVVRGSDGELRAMSNVCRHRAGPIAKGAGKRPVLQCGYHGWTYSLEGRLLKTPEFDGVEGFDRASCTLPRFRAAEWLGLVFVNLDPNAATLHDFLGDIIPDMAARDTGGFKLAAEKNWELDCNWKVYVDNYLEGYHIPIVHPSLFRELDYPKYWMETKPTYSIQHAPVKRADRIRLTEGQDDVRYFWLFPNLMLNVYPDNFSTNVILPLGARRTLTLFHWYFRDPESAATQQQLADTVSFSDEIQLEDIEICEAVQRVLRSATYDSGRYSPSRENGVHHFHSLYAQCMGINATA